MQIKRHFYNGTHYQLDMVNKRLILSKEFHEMLLSKKLFNKFGFKKIGGSSIGNVLKVDSFKSDFEAFVNISWLGKPILDTTYIDAGIAIEPIVLENLENVLSVKIQRFDPKEYEFDYFKDKDDIIGGLPDGYIKSKNIVLEIKTAKEDKYDNWNTYGIPVAYLKQAQLYAYLMNSDNFFLVATFLKPEDYADPKNFDIKNRKFKAYPFQVNKDQVQDDIQKVKSWYTHYTKLGISPVFDEVKDAEILEWLKCSNKKEFDKLVEKWTLEGKIKNE